MSVCFDNDCTCSQHHILDHLFRGLNEEAKSILQNIKNLNEFTDASQATMLHYSSKYGNAEMTQYSIDHGCNVNAQDNIGVTPLMLAIDAHEITTTEILLKNNADIYMTDNNGENSLVSAFYLCLDSSQIDSSESNSHIILKMLFDKVHDDFLNGTLAQILLNANDMTKFAIVAFGNAEVTRFVLKNGYSIDFHEPEKNLTALHSAIMLAKFENAKILIEHGANGSASDDYSPLSYYKNFEDVDENSEVLKCFLRYSTSLHTTWQVGERDYTDVKYLLYFGNKETVRTVLTSGIDVNASFTQNECLLLILIVNENVDVLDLFGELNIKFDVNARDENGRTALMKAVYLGCLKKVEFLLQRGANVNIISSSGDTALSEIAVSIISENPDEEINLAKIAELLLLYGAHPLPFYRQGSNFNRSSQSYKIITAHSVLLARYGYGSSLKKFKSSGSCNSNECLKQLKEMENFKVYGTVTLFKLLTEREEKIIGYACNQEFISAFSSVMENLSNFEPYYVRRLQLKVSKAMDKAKLLEKVAPAIQALTGLCIIRYHAIVYKIISYLDSQDHCNLCGIDHQSV